VELPVPPVSLDERTRRSVRLFIRARMLPVATRLGRLALLTEQARRVEALSHARRSRGAVPDEVAARAGDLLDEVLADRRDDLPAPPSAHSVAWRGGRGSGSLCWRGRSGELTQA